MAEFSRLVITGKGQVLLAKMMTGETDVEFTKVSISNMKYTLEELNMLTDLAGVKQTVPVSKVTRTNDVAITIETSFDNTELTEGYYMRALGLYAIDPDEGEILYAVTIELTGCCYMPAYNGVAVSGACIKLVTTVGNAENVSLEVDPGVYATVGEIKELRECVDGIETWKDNTQKRLDNWGPTIVGHGQVINSLRDSIGNLKPVATSGDYNDLGNRPDLKPVATSGSYNDLLNKPAIPVAVRVKGNVESSYRTGDVNLTPENIGAVSRTGDTVTGDLTVKGTIKGKVDYHEGKIGTLYTRDIKFYITDKNTGITFDDYYSGEYDDYVCDIVMIYTGSDSSGRSSKIELRGQGRYYDENGNVDGISEGFIDIEGEKINVLAGKTIYLCAGIPNNNINRGIMLKQSMFYPTSNDWMSLGTADYKWANIYAANGVIQTSDKNEKNSISEIALEKAQALIYGLKPSTYKMNNGTAGRTHWGLISQDIETLFEEIGMTSLDFAGFIKSPKMEEIKDNNGKVIETKEIEGEYDYSLRYDEFIAPIIKVIQTQHEEIETLRKKTELLEQKILDLIKA